MIFGQVEGAAARLAAGRMLAALGTARGSPQEPVAFTASAGLASTVGCDGSTSAPTLLKRADHALYRAKREGKNRLIVADD